MTDAAPPWSPKGAAESVPPQPLDSLAVQSLLVFGGLFPPKSCLSSLGNDWANGPGEALRSPLVAADIRAHATAVLDAELLRIVENRQPLVLFSGGVDSSLMAARLLALGRNDLRLLHYQFRDDDQESLAARAVADELGVHLEVVRRTPERESDCLESPGTVYPIPFGDQSAAPTAELCAGVLQAADPHEVVVLDGTGADGAFGLGSRTLTATALGPVRKVGLPALNAAYRGGAWRRRGRSEYYGRVARRLQTLGVPAGVIAQNALFGVLYDTPDLPVAIEQWEQAMELAGVRDAVGKVVLTDLSITCARIFAQKTFGPLTAAGFKVGYPFLSAELGALGIRHTAEHPRAGAKTWMKEQLARHVSPALVYRTKSGFTDPARELFDARGFRDALGEALTGDGKARSVCVAAR